MNKRQRVSGLSLAFGPLRMTKGQWPLPSPTPVLAAFSGLLWFLSRIKEVPWLNLVLSVVLFLLVERMLACADRCSQKSSCRASSGAGFNCHHFSIGPPYENFMAISLLFIRFFPLGTSTTSHLGSVFASPRASVSSSCLPPIFISTNSAYMCSSYAVLDHSSGDRDIVLTYVPTDSQRCVGAPFEGGDKPLSPSMV